MMRASERPAARAASTYSRRFCTRISARTMRAYDTQPTTVMAMMIERCPGPSTNTSASTSTMNGKATTTSTRRITAVSAKPP